MEGFITLSQAALRTLSTLLALVIIAIYGRNSALWNQYRCSVPKNYGLQLAAGILTVLVNLYFGLALFIRKLYHAAPEAATSLIVCVLWIVCIFKTDPTKNDYLDYCVGDTDWSRAIKAPTKRAEGASGRITKDGIQNAVYYDHPPITTWYKAVDGALTGIFIILLALSIFNLFKGRTGTLRGKSYSSRTGVI